MLVSPKNIRPHIIQKQRTLNFDTLNKLKENGIFMLTDNYDDIGAVLNSSLFRPQQLVCTYSPRFTLVNDKIRKRVNQEEVYELIKEKSGKKIKYGKTLLTSYGQRNLFYNTLPMFSMTLDYLSSLRKGIALQMAMSKYQEKMLNTAVNELKYKENYLIIPMTRYIDNFRTLIYAVDTSSEELTNPVVMFLKSVKNKTYDTGLFSKFDRIIFYNPKADALIPLDLNDEEFDKHFQNDLMKILRLNNFNNGTDSLSDIEDATMDEIESADKTENKKDAVMNAVLKDIAKTLKVNKIDSFEPTSVEEEKLALAIERKIDTFINNKENLNKTLNDLIDDVQKDVDIKSKAINFIETKRSAAQRADSLAKGITKEQEIVSTNLKDMVSDEKVVEPVSFNIDFAPDIVKTTVLANLDDEYLRKQHKEDLNAVFSTFSSSEYIPMTIDKMEIEDTSTDFDQVETYKIRYKTDEGNAMSIKVDVPKIIDGKYLYLGGNKKDIVKQIIRLPIVKTKADRVEITTNFNKMTIERSSGKLFRANEYLLKIFNEFKANKLITIEYGSCSADNAEYKNIDFQYSELADSITSIKGVKYTVYFNQKTIRNKISLMDFDDDVITDKMTPIALSSNENKNSFVFLEDTKVYEFDGNNKTKVADSLFDFITRDVLDRQETKLPHIGKSFVYTTVKILAAKYPMFAVLGLVNGMTNILKRYNINYHTSEKREPTDVNFVEVKFKNKYFYYEDKIQNTLLLNILYTMNTEEYDFEEFDLDQPYLDYFISKQGQPQYIKNTLKLNLPLYMDPITKSICHDLGYPEDINDLILYANTLLANNSYRYQNDLRNYRIRGNELVSAILYSILANGYLKYQNSKLNGKSVDKIDLSVDINGKSISGQRALITALVTQPNINDHSTLNPIQEIENSCSASMKGFKGSNRREPRDKEIYRCKTA